MKSTSEKVPAKHVPNGPMVFWYVLVDFSRDAWLDAFAMPMAMFDFWRVCLTSHPDPVPVGFQLWRYPGIPPISSRNIPWTFWYGDIMGMNGLHPSLSLIVTSHRFPSLEWWELESGNHLPNARMMFQLFSGFFRLVPFDSSARRLGNRYSNDIPVISGNDSNDHFRAKDFLSQEMGLINGGAIGV